METLQESGELVFLFQLTQGHTSSSYAAHTALQAGLPPEIIKRGQEVCRYDNLEPLVLVYTARSKPFSDLFKAVVTIFQLCFSKYILHLAG